jgi:uncharacterized protein
MKLSILPGSFALCRLSPDNEVPGWVWENKTLLSVTYTEDELSIVCQSSLIPSYIRAEVGWVAIKVQGPLDFSFTGVLAALSGPLAAGGVSIFAVSTFDTDYILVKERDISQAKLILEQNGHFFE